MILQIDTDKKVLEVIKFAEGEVFHIDVVSDLLLELGNVLKKSQKPVISDAVKKFIADGAVGDR